MLPIYDSEREKRIVAELTGLVRWASKKYSIKLSGRYDYWDFFEDGLLILALCMNKWNTSFLLEDEVGFKKYVKTSLFNRFRQIEVASHCKKRFGVHVPIEKVFLGKKKFSFPIEDGKEKKESIPYCHTMESPLVKISCDGGFGEVHFKELVEHISSFLSEKEKRIFELMVDPPEDLVEDAIHEMSRKQKQSLLTGTYDCRRVKITIGCLFNYYNKNEEKSSEHGFLKSIKKIRRVVVDAIENKLS